MLTVTEPFASPLFANIEPLTTIYQGWPVDLSDHPNGCWLMVHSCPAPADAGAGPAAYAVEIQAAYTSLTKDGEAGVLGWIHVVKCNSNHKNNYFPGCYELEVNEAIPATTILLSPSPDLPIHALWEMDPSRRQAVGDLIRHAVMCRSARGFDAPVSPPPGSKTAPPEEIGIKAKCGLVGAQTKAITAALLHKEHFSDAGTHANRYTRWDHTPHIYEEATIHGIAIGRPYLLPTSCKGGMALYLDPDGTSMEYVLIQVQTRTCHQHSAGSSRRRSDDNPRQVRWETGSSTQPAFGVAVSVVRDGYPDIPAIFVCTLTLRSLTAPPAEKAQTSTDATADESQRLVQACTNAPDHGYILRMGPMAIIYTACEDKGANTHLDFFLVPLGYITPHYVPTGSTFAKRASLVKTAQELMFYTRFGAIDKGGLFTILDRCGVVVKSGVNSNWCVSDDPLPPPPTHTLHTHTLCATLHRLLYRPVPLCPALSRSVPLCATRTTATLIVQVSSARLER